MKNKIALSFFLLFLFVTGKSDAQVSSGATWLKINEVDYDQISTDTSEFIELVNMGSAQIDLGTYMVLLFNGSTSAVYDSIQLPSVPLNPGGIFVLCGNSGGVPNCDMVLPTLSNIIQNGSPDAIALWDTLSSSVIDAVSYEGSCATPYVEGIGVPPAQSDSTIDYTSIGRFPDGTDTDDNSTDFHLQCITPGASNTNVSTNCQSPVSTGASIKIKDRLSIYPNPASEKIFVLGIVHSKSIQFARVYNCTGKICLTQIVPAGSNGIAVNVNSLANGIYSVVLSTENASSKKTFVVSR